MQYKHLKQMKQLLTTLICLMLIAACGENKSNKTPSTDNYLHVIDLSKTEFADIKLSELFTNVTPIVLETTDESLMGSITKVVITPEYIIVLDHMIAKALFLFTKDGTFLRKFGRIGNGPGEYANVPDFCYDETTGTIYMLDSRLSRVNLYNIHTGEFLKSIKLKNSGLSRCIYYQAGELYTDLSYFTTESEKYLLNRRNQSTGEIEEAWFDVEKYANNADYTNRNPFRFGNGNSFKFHTFFMNGIMQVEKGKITPFLAFTPEYTLEKKNVQSLDLSNGGRDINEKLPKTNKVFDISNYFEHKDMIFFDFCLGSEMRALIYNQKTKDFKAGNLFNDLMYKENSPNTLHQFVTYGDNGMYAKLGYEMNVLKIFLEKDFISESFKNTAIDLLNLEKDANPVLLYYEFKD